MAVLAFIRPKAVALPVLMCLDFDTERGRPSARPGLDVAQNLVEVWRRRRLPVVHFRWLRTPKLLGAFRWSGRWRDGFKPKPGELLFDRPRPSAFSSAEFCRLVREAGASPLIVMGPRNAVLETIAEAAGHAVRLLVVYDTVVQRRRHLSDLTEPFLGPSCRLVSSAEALALASSETGGIR